MNILGSVFISALAASLFVYESPTLLTEVQPEPAALVSVQDAAANSDAAFGVDAFYGRPHMRRYIREIAPSPYCR
jgi:hypothetical protein